MFIFLTHASDEITLRINVLSIVMYNEYHGQGITIPEVCTKVNTSDGKFYYVLETPEQIDVKIEEAKEAELQNIDNILIW